jgi:uncharacterized repeat protein (TIGR03803 family)
MMRVNGWRWVWEIILVCLVIATTASAQDTFTTLVNFDGSNGDEPHPPFLVQGANGGLFGTTASGGMAEGTIFDLTNARGLKTLYTFTCDQNSCVGAMPTGLTLATDGDFYGTTWSGGTDVCGCGTVFKMTRAGVLTTLHNFDATDGSLPAAGVTEGIDGNFYGITVYGGINNIGTIFRMTPGDKLTTLHSFNGTDGAEPISGLIQGDDGNFYGTTEDGGLPNCNDGSGCGTVFKITPSGSLTTLYQFCAQANCTDGANPESALFQGLDGNFYGTTHNGGIGPCGSLCGTIFKISPDGLLTTLYSFCSLPSCFDGIWPVAGVEMATDGNLYGVTTYGGATYGVGVIFSLSPDGTLNILHTFDGTDGIAPETALLQATDGAFYGTTISGGKYNSGTLYRLNMGLRPFVAFVRAVGKIGQTGGLLGQGFTGTTNVAINGIPTNFTVVSDTYITATVPAGATTGYVTVITPSRTLTSNVPFRVIP